jgi:hypothetical protein
MIADLDETLRQLLIAEMPVKNKEVDISFHQPKREWSSRLNKPTINLFLYNLRENTNLRQPQWESFPRGDNQSHLKRSPFRVDCFYMITVWAAEPEDEHRLLSRTLLALFRFPVLPEDRLVGGLKNQPFEIQTLLADPETLTNPADLWSAMDNEMRSSIPFMVTLAFDPWKEITGPLVHTLTIRPGQARGLPRKRRLSETDNNIDMVFIGGAIHDKDGQPLPGIQVSVKGTGISDSSDAQGRFILGSLPPADYTLIARLPDGKTRENKIRVPATDGNYDINL